MIPQLQFRRAFEAAIWLWVVGYKLFLPGGSNGKESACQCRRVGFDPWVGKIPWRREWLSTPVFLPGKYQEQKNLVSNSPWGPKESDTSEWITLPLPHGSTKYNSYIEKSQLQCT